MGADDYMTKPFNPRVLLARIKAVLRRELTGADGVAVPLNTAEFVLLNVFLHHPQLVLSRDQLLDLTCSRDADVFDRSIDNRISRLRKKIEADPKHPKL